MKTENGLTFDEYKELEKLKQETIKLEHQCKMEYAKYIRETEKLKHEMELERSRIKSAEIRKTQMRKFMGDPYKQ